MSVYSITQNSGLMKKKNIIMNTSKKHRQKYINFVQTGFPQKQIFTTCFLEILCFVKNFYEKWIRLRTIYVVGQRIII